MIELNPKVDGVQDHTIAGFVPMALLGTNWLKPVRFESRPWAVIKGGYTRFRDGDVLLAKITPCFENGKAGVAAGLPNGIGAGSTEYFVCRPRSGVLDPKYLYAYFKTHAFLHDGAMAMTGSVGHKGVTKGYLSDSEIPACTDA